MTAEPSILIADDNKHIRQILRIRLKEQGYRVIEASNGPEVLDQCTVQCFDAVILDHSMPGANGRAIARAIRDQSEVPIIILSGYDRECFRDVVTRLPDIYYLQKPLDQDKLTTLLKEFCQRREKATAPEGELVSCGGIP